MLLFDLWFGLSHARHDRGERFFYIHRHVARLAALFLLGIGEGQTTTINRQQQPNLFSMAVSWNFSF